MSSEVIIGILSLLGTLCGTFGGIMTSSKLTNYRIQQLEKKVEKHNSVVERMALAEREIRSVWHVVDELKEEVKEE